MPWGKLDDGLYDHPKVHALGRLRLAGVGLLVHAVSYSNRYLTDGFVPLSMIREWEPPRQLVVRMVQVGLFDSVTSEGVQVHDYLEFSDSRESVLARRKAAADRQQRHRHASVTRDDDVTHTGSHSTPPARVSRPDPSRPDLDSDAPPDGGASSAPARPPKPNGGGPLAGVVAEIAEHLGKPNGVDYGVGEGEAKVFAYLARAGAAMRPDSGLGRRLMGLIERRGYDVVLERAAQLTRNGPMSDRQWVFGLEEALEKPPSGADARAADRQEANDRHEARVQAQTKARRVEQFRWTGNWPWPEPEPEWNPAWGARP